MQYKENLGASCQNCTHQNGKNPKSCRKCQNHDGMQGWEPAEGVRVNVFPVYSGPSMILQYCRQVITEEAI